MLIKKQLQLIKQVTGLSQEGLARELGVSFPTLNSWINGKSEPRTQAVAVIEELYLKCTGQAIVPKDALEAKKLLIRDFASGGASMVKKIMERQDLYDEFLLQLTYNTNSIEGSTLSENETAAVLFEDTTLPKKTLVEQMEVKNHKAALDFLFKHVRQGGALDENFVMRLHAILMNAIHEDAGFYRRHGVRIVGSSVPTANYMKVPDLMAKLFAGAAGPAKADGDIVQLVTSIHWEFEKIHPFADGNGRVGRLLMNAILLGANLPPAVIKQENKQFYYTYLQKAQMGGDQSLLEDFICDAVLEGLYILTNKT